MQQTRHSLGYVMLIIAVIVLPTAAALGWYQITRDPEFRPLGITREALRAYGVPGSGTDVTAYVDWPASQASQTARQQLARDIAISFAAKGVDVQVVFRRAEGTPRITYVVGKSVLGPYPASRAAQGIEAAVEAYRMY